MRSLHVALLYFSIVCAFACAYYVLIAASPSEIPLGAATRWESVVACIYQSVSVSTGASAEAPTGPVGRMLVLINRIAAFTLMIVVLLRRSTPSVQPS